MSWPLFYKDWAGNCPTPLTLLNKCSYPQGPMTGKIAFIGEAPGQNEERFRDVFSGASGKELHRMCADAGIDIHECLRTNVFMERPERNDIKVFFGKKGEEVSLTDRTPCMGGLYVRSEKAWHLARLQAELEQFRPSIIVPLGNTPLWATCGIERISTVRGSVRRSVFPEGIKALPTFHPAYILRNWEDRILVIADLIKAERESHYPDFRFPQREIWVQPTLDDLAIFHEKYIAGCEVLAIDIETMRTPDGKHTISCISLAPSSDRAIVIPFVSHSKRPSHSYWEEGEELVVLEYLRETLGPGGPYSILGQNGIFDIQFLWDEFRIPVYGYHCDTMLLHHAWQPELSKSLAFLAAAYTDERSWKWLRPKGQKQEKKDE